MIETDGHWWCTPFHDLELRDLYDLLQLRGEVFVVEQECAYLDPDGEDHRAWHWLYREEDQLLAYQRCFPPGTAYEDASAIGRIVVAPQGRGRGLSRDLVRRGIAFNRKRWPEHPIRIGAQAHLKDLYESLGFVVSSEPYLEDGIPHLEMDLPA